MLTCTVEAEVACRGVVAKIQQFSWDRDDEIELESDDYLINLPLSPQRLHEQTRWRLPESGVTARAALFGLMPPHFPIRFRRDKGLVRSFTCEVDPEHFERVTSLSSWTTEDLLILLRSNNPFFRVLLNRMATEVEHPGFGTDAMIASLSDFLLVEIARLLRRETQERVDGQILDWQLVKLRDVVQQSPNISDLTVASLAAMCGISGRHLMRGFKAATGMTIHSYIDNARLEKVKRLLEDGDLQLKGIASSLGFASASHMSCVFKKLAGMTPSEYRAIDRAKRYVPAWDQGEAELAKADSA